MAEEKQYNKVVIVDENDNVIGAENALLAKEKGWLRSCVRVFVFSESNKVLLQRRGRDVLRPLEIDISTAGCVDEGESRKVAAYRELAEETGIENTLLQLISEPFRSPGTVNGVYKTVVPDDQEFIIDNSEVEELFWVSVEMLDEMIESGSDKCTPGLVDTWTQLRDKLVSTSL